MGHMAAPNISMVEVIGSQRASAPLVSIGTPEWRPTASSISTSAAASSKARSTSPRPFSITAASTAAPSRGSTTGASSSMSRKTRPAASSAR